jgi:hypothetical protein
MLPLISNLALTLTLLVEPPVDSESLADPSETPAAENSVGLVEDMPDPYAADWEPPEGPRAPQPVSPPLSPPPPSMSPAAEHPRNSALPSNSSTMAAVHGQRLQLAGIVFGVAGAIGLVVGVYLYDDLQKTRTALSAEQSLLATGGGSITREKALQMKLREQQQGMTVSLAAGGASVGVGAILFGAGTSVKRQSPSRAITWLSPGPGLVGLALNGRF